MHPAILVAGTIVFLVIASLVILLMWPKNKEATSDPDPDPIVPPRLPPDDETQPESPRKIKFNLRTSASDLLDMGITMDLVNSTIETASAISNDILPNHDIEISVYVEEQYDGTLGAAIWGSREVFLAPTSLSTLVRLNETTVAQSVVVLLHETLHVLGVVCLQREDLCFLDTDQQMIWNSQCDGVDYTGLKLIPSNSYLGCEANAKFLQLVQATEPSISGPLFLPIEADQGPGTDFVHVEENIPSCPVLEKLVSTGFLSYQTYLSTIDLGFLVDLGYEVNRNSKYVVDLAQHDDIGTCLPPTVQASDISSLGTG